MKERRGPGSAESRGGRAPDRKVQEEKEGAGSRRRAERAGKESRLARKGRGRRTFEEVDLTLANGSRRAGGEALRLRGVQGSRSESVTVPEAKGS